jgi:hypothetical protein
MTSDQKLVILTIHGIGFQQPPTDSTAGYADMLHDNLRQRQALGDLLGNDPQRRPGPRGPVYVRSANPDAPRNTEWGLSRLGKWCADGSIDDTGTPLTDGDEPFAHVALVYTPLEDVAPPPGAGVGTLAEAALELGHYASVAGAVRLVVGDAWAALHEHAAAQPAEAAARSLRPRDDVLTAGRHRLARLLHRQPASFGPLGTIRTLEDDVVAYVCRNDLRERIRDFIEEALRRLLARPDVSGVVVNAHSQGTVAGFDVLRQFHTGTPSRVRAFVTAGSPLRKYADLFSWGHDMGELQSVTWLNFWDENDPVADPLDPPASWRPGDPPARDPGGLGLFWAVDAGGNQFAVTVDDTPADNLKNSSGGSLQAHNYWDNHTDVIEKLATLLKEIHPGPEGL